MKYIQAYLFQLKSELLSVQSMPSDKPEHVSQAMAIHEMRIEQLVNFLKR